MFFLFVCLFLLFFFFFCFFFCYSSNPYKSVDPAPPSIIQDTEMLKNTLLDESRLLFERYRYCTAQICNG